MISFGELSARLAYDPETGEFTWLAQAGYIKPGRKAGVINGHGYVNIKFNQKIYRAHILAWVLQTGSWPDHWIDHINGVRSDNRWSNLRAADQLKNAWNRAVNSSSKTGIRGVTLRNGRYSASLKCDGQRIHIGRFDTAEEAKTAHVEAMADHYGQFSSETSRAAIGREVVGNG